VRAIGGSVDAPATIRIIKGLTRGVPALFPEH